MKVNFIISSDFAPEWTFEVEDDITFFTLKSLYWDKAKQEGHITQPWFIPVLQDTEGIEIDETNVISKTDEYKNGGRLHIYLFESPI